MRTLTLPWGRPRRSTGAASRAPLIVLTRLPLTVTTALTSGSSLAATRRIRKRRRETHLCALGSWAAWVDTGVGGGGGGATCLALTVQSWTTRALLPARSVASTANERAPGDPVSSGAPGAAVPEHVSMPEPASLQA